MKRRLALITGGTGALGKAVTVSFLQADFEVVVTYRNKAELEELLTQTNQYRDQLTAIETDVTNLDSLQQLANQLKDRQPLTALICLVGGFAKSSLEPKAIAAYDKLMNLNVRSFFLTCQTFVPLMQADSTISPKHVIGISSKRALEPAKGMALAAASKAAVAALVKNLAKDLADDQISINAIAPSTIDTPANREAMPKADHSQWAQPEDIAETILFLCTRPTTAVTGTVIAI